MSMQDPLDILDVIEDHLDDDGDNEPEHLFMNGDVYQGSLPPPPQNKVVNKSDLLAKTGNAVSTVGSYGVSVAQLATGAPGVVALATGATIAGTGPIGLLVASMVFTVGFSIQAGISATKTHKHIQELEQIHAAVGSYACDKKGSLDHSHVANTVLPYIIAKKRAKRARKAFSTVPFAVSLETARAGLKATIKKATGRKGRNRKYHALVLARHHCTSNCALTAAIIKSLFWVDDGTVEDLRSENIEEVAAVLSTKMKSV